MVVLVSDWSVLSICPAGANGLLLGLSRPSTVLGIYEVGYLYYRFQWFQSTIMHMRCSKGSPSMILTVGLCELVFACSWRESVGSHSHHVCSAHDLCEPRVHTAGAAAANRRINHPSINNAYVSQRSDIRAR